jgi:alpha-tubulin suppressor-like RCC1 family protein
MRANISDTFCALRDNGTVWCWGNGNYGRLGYGSSANSDIPVQVTGITNATAIASSDLGSCALLADGSITCWGNNEDAQLVPGTAISRGGVTIVPGTDGDYQTPVAVAGITEAVEISMGGEHACARLADDTLTCWGSLGSRSELLLQRVLRRPAALQP